MKRIRVFLLCLSLAGVNACEQHKPSDLSHIEGTPEAEKASEKTDAEPASAPTPTPESTSGAQGNR